MKKKYGGNKYVYGGLGSLIIILIIVVIFMTFKFQRVQIKKLQKNIKRKYKYV